MYTYILNFVYVKLQTHKFDIILGTFLKTTPFEIIDIGMR